MNKFTSFIRRFFDKTLWKFLLVGVVNTLFGSGLMFLLYNVFHVGYWLSSASNYVFGSILSYFLNRRFTFQDKLPTRETAGRFVICIGISYLLSYGVAKPLAKALLSAASVSVQENIAMLAGMGFYLLLNYVGQRFFVFSDKFSHRKKDA